MACMFYLARCIKIIFNLLLTQLVKYDVHTTRKIKFMHAIISHILLLSVLDKSESVNERIHTHQQRYKIPYSRDSPEVPIY